MSDKRELLKLKQGLITEEESTLELDKTPIIKPTGKKAVENFFYHYKLQIIFVSFFAVVALCFTYFMLTEEKADITILFISDDEETSSFLAREAANLEFAIERFVPDFDNNGKVHAKCLFIDLTTQVGTMGRNPDAVYGERIKLFGEVRSGNALLYVGNAKALEDIPLGAEMPLEDFYLPITEESVFLPVKGSALEDFADFNEDIPEDLYIALRIGNNENELIVLENILGL